MTPSAITVPPPYSPKEDEEWQELLEASRLSVLSRERELEEEKIKQRKSKLKLIMNNVRVCKDLDTGFFFTGDNEFVQIMQDPILRDAVRQMGLSMKIMWLTTRPGEPSQAKITIQKTSK